MVQYDTRAPFEQRRRLSAQLAVDTKAQFHLAVGNPAHPSRGTFCSSGRHRLEWKQGHSRLFLAVWPNRQDA